jgi:hypothetical protein
MTRYHTLLVALMSFTFTTGCATDDDDTGGGDPTNPTPGEEALVNGEPASTFYGRFTHATSRKGVEGAAAFTAQADGRNAFLITFFLMPDNRFEVFYAEGPGEVSSTGHSINLIGDSRKRRSGTWRIDGSKLRLGDLVSCDGMALDDRPVLRCTLDGVILTTAAQGRSGTFAFGFGEATPDDTEFADYVP